MNMKPSVHRRGAFRQPLSWKLIPGAAAPHPLRAFGRFPPSASTGGLLGDAHPCFSHPKSPEYDICHHRACAALQIGSSPPPRRTHLLFQAKETLRGSRGRKGRAPDWQGTQGPGVLQGHGGRDVARKEQGPSSRAGPGPPGVGNGPGLPGRQGMREPCGKGSGWGRGGCSRRGLPGGEGPRFAAATLLSADNGAGCLLRAGRQLAIHRERCVTQMSRGS